MKAVFFDFDGVLFDTSEGIFEGMRKVLTDNNIAVPGEEVLHSFIGPPVYDTFRSYFHLEGELFKKVYGEYREYYDKHSYVRCTLCEGIRELLEYLKDKGILACVVSFKARFMVERILGEHGLLELFTGGLGGTDTGGTAPDKSDIARDRLRVLGLQPGEVLFVGDRKYDIQAAHACGIRCASVTWGFGSIEEFREYGADFIVNTTKEIEALCEKL